MFDCDSHVCRVSRFASLNFAESRLVRQPDAMPVAGPAKDGPCVLYAERMHDQIMGTSLSEANFVIPSGSSSWEAHETSCIFLRILLPHGYCNNSTCCLK